MTSTLLQFGDNFQINDAAVVLLCKESCCIYMYIIYSLAKQSEVSEHDDHSVVGAALKSFHVRMLMCSVRMREMRIASASTALSPRPPTNFSPSSLSHVFSFLQHQRRSRESGGKCVDPAPIYDFIDAGLGSPTLGGHGAPLHLYR